jgi:hypothetical protein
MVAARFARRAPSLAPKPILLILVPDQKAGARARARTRRAGRDREVRFQLVTPAKAGVQRWRHRLLENQLFSVS